MLLSGLNAATTLLAYTFLTLHQVNFHLSGFVNKQNYCYWDENNPANLHERPGAEREFCKPNWTMYWEKWRPPRGHDFQKNLISWRKESNPNMWIFNYAKKIKIPSKYKQVISFLKMCLPMPHPVYSFRRCFCVTYYKHDSLATDIKRKCSLMNQLPAEPCENC
jgi:hypothetical protein